MSEASQPPILMDELRAVVRKVVPGAADGPIAIEEITRHTNLNYVFRVTVGPRTLFVKAIPARLKLFGVPLPQERMLGEIGAIRLFREHCGAGLCVPDLVFVDDERFLIGMTDVSGGRVLVADATEATDSTLAGAAEALGIGLANVHSGTRGCASVQSAPIDAIIRQTIFSYLVVPPSELGDARIAAVELLADVRERRECLVHGDLWPKNIFVGNPLPPAVIDFEGALTADPAFDLGTICAASMMSVLETPALMPHHVDAMVRFFASYRRRVADQAWAEDSVARALRLAGVFIAVRAFGPTAFPMSDAARQRAIEIAVRLVTAPPPVDAYIA